MRLAVALLAAVAVLVGCSSSGGNAGASETASSEADSPTVAATYATAGEAVQASCAAFDRFFTDLSRLTPHGSQATLINDASAVLQPLIHTDATLTGASRKLFDDATTLLGHVGSSSWPTQGTPIDPQIQAVTDDCS